MKRNHKGCNVDALMQNIAAEYGEEVDALLSTKDPQYKTNPHIKPIFWMNDLEDNPGKYPKLSGVSTAKQKRYISYYLKLQGRVPSSKTRNARAWVLPEAGCKV